MIDNPASSENIFDFTQEHMQSVLRETSWFDPIPMVLEKKGDIRASVQQALAQGAAKQTPVKSGIAILFLTPTGRNNQPERQEIEAVNLEMSATVSIFENVTVNTSAQGIGKRAQAVMHNVIYYLQRHNVRGRRLYRFVEYSSDEENGIVGYHLVFAVLRRITGPVS